MICVMKYRNWDEIVKAFEDGKSREEIIIIHDSDDCELCDMFRSACMSRPESRICPLDVGFSCPECAGGYWNVVGDWFTGYSSVSRKKAYHAAKKIAEAMRLIKFGE